MRIEGTQPHRIHPHVNHQIKNGGLKSVPSFKETLSSFLGDVNSVQNESSEAKKSFLAGKINDVHQVMNKSEESKVAFNMLVELRNKSLDGYNEIKNLNL